MPVTVFIRRAHGIPLRPLDVPSGEQPGMRRPGRRSARLATIGAVVTFLVVVAWLAWHLTPEGHAIADGPSLQSTPESHAASPLHMGPVSTGVVAVDDAVRGFLKGDVDEAFSQLVVQQVPCGTLPWGGTPELTCLGTEAPGTVHAMVLSACEPKWVTVEAAKAEIGTLLAHEPGLYRVARMSDGYRAVLSWLDAPDRLLVLTIASVGVTSYRAGCDLPSAPNPGHELELVTTPNG